MREIFISVTFYCVYLTLYADVSIRESDGDDYESGSFATKNPCMLTLQSPFASDSSTALPSRWDSRERGWVSSVKDQGNYSTCWIFATMAAVETSVLMNGGPELDLSEKNLANLHGWDYSPIAAGTALRAASYLLRWAGPVLECQDPYPIGGSTVAEFGASRPFAPALHIQNMIEIPARSTALDNERLKKAVMEYGAVVARYYHFKGSKYKNYQTGAYYSAGTNETNHAVSLIGWDDDYPIGNFATLPPAKGAWIVKDSHGISNGTNGFLYISYYDTSFAFKDSVAFVAVSTNVAYDAVYGYDKLGRCNTRGTGSLSSKRYGAAVFDVVGGSRQELCAVGFYARSESTQYEISVYTNANHSSPISGVCAISNQCGTVKECGYVTVPLDCPIGIAPGDAFSIVIGMMTPHYEYQIAYEWATDNASRATAKRGQTFYGTSKSSWQDFCDYKPTASFCCKAYVRNHDCRKFERPANDMQEYCEWLQEDFSTWFEACCETPQSIATLKGTNNRSLWENWLIGTSPLEDSGDLRAFIQITNGVPTVSWSPDLNNGSGKKGVREYTI